MARARDRLRGHANGRIAWAGPDEFWTVSDGRAGQASAQPAPNRRRRWKTTRSATSPAARSSRSYAQPAFEADSYQAMHGAACLGPTDCWFGGDPLPEPQIGAFHLHWNGRLARSRTVPRRRARGRGHAGVRRPPVRERAHRLRRSDGQPRNRSNCPPCTGSTPKACSRRSNAERSLPLYGPRRARRSARLPAPVAPPKGPCGRPPERKAPNSANAGQVTVVRRVGHGWSQVIGPEHPLGPILPSRSGRRTGAARWRSEDGAGQRHRRRTEHRDAWLALAPVKNSSA